MGISLSSSALKTTFNHEVFWFSPLVLPPLPPRASMDSSPSPMALLSQLMSPLWLLPVLIILPSRELLPQLAMLLPPLLAMLAMPLPLLWLTLAITLPLLPTLATLATPLPLPSATLLPLWSLPPPPLLLLPLLPPLLL